jgi:hypothetical protein
LESSRNAPKSPTNGRPESYPQHLVALARASSQIWKLVWFGTSGGNAWQVVQLRSGRTLTLRAMRVDIDPAVWGGYNLSGGSPVRLNLREQTRERTGALVFGRKLYRIDITPPTLDSTSVPLFARGPRKPR